MFVYKYSSIRCGGGINAHIMILNEEEKHRDNIEDIETDRQTHMTRIPHTHREMDHRKRQVSGLMI